MSTQKKEYSQLTPATAGLSPCERYIAPNHYIALHARRFDEPRALAAAWSPEDPPCHRNAVDLHAPARLYAAYGRQAYGGWGGSGRVVGSPTTLAERTRIHGANFHALWRTADVNGKCVSASTFQHHLCIHHASFTLGGCEEVVVLHK